MPTRDPRTVSVARRLRAEPTPAEQALWRVLRRNKDAHWRRQAPIGGYLADFACLKAKFIVEVDGGAHDLPAAERRDLQRTAMLEAQGFHVHRVTNAEVLHDPKRVADVLSGMAVARLPSPLPRSGDGVGDGGQDVRSGSRFEAEHPVERPVPHPRPLPQQELEEGGPNTGAPPQKPSRRASYIFPETPTSNQVDMDDLVLVGAIVGAFGVQGEVRVRPFTASPEGVVSYGALYDAQGCVVLTPKRWRAIKDGLAVTALEVPTRGAAEALRHTPLHVPRALLPPADEDEFYHVDLIGCAVETPDGAPLGEVIAVHDFGAGDVLELRDAKGAQLYLEFSKARVPMVDIAARRLVAMPPEPDAS